MKKIFICDDVNPLPQSSCKTILWNSSPLASNHLSISEIIESNAKILRTTYLAHIHDLGLLKIKNNTVINLLKIDKDLSFWWLTLFSQKCNFIKSENIDNIIKFMAFELWADTNTFTAIELKTNNKNLYLCLKTWCNKKNIDFISNNQNSNIKRTEVIYPSLMFMKSIFNLAFNLVKRWNLKGHNLEAWKNSDGKLSFFSYFNKDQIEYESKFFKSNFWGDLPEELNSLNKKTNWLHLLAGDYSKKSNNKIVSTLNDFSKNSNQIHLTIYSFLSVTLIKIVLKEWLRVIYKSKKIRHIFSGHSSPYKKNYLLFFSDEDFYKSFYGFEGLNSILFFYLFKEALRLLPKQGNGLFLQENQPWEISLINQWKANRHKKIIGCPHTTIRFWDLRYYFLKETINLDVKYKLPVPDHIALNGDHAYNTFLDMEYSSDKLFKVEALRYMHLNEIKKIPRSNIIEKTDPKKILILGDYSKESTIKSIKLIQDAFEGLSSDQELILKPHPASVINNDDVSLDNIKVTNSPIDEIINQCNIVFSCNVTSAALDSYFYDVPIICFHDLSKLNLSPVRGLNNIHFVNSSEEFRELITNDIYMISNKKNFNYFYLDKGFSGWKKLLQIDDIKSNIVQS